MPAEILSAYAEVRTLLEVAPWSGSPYRNEKPDGPMRTLIFGSSGAVEYLILTSNGRSTCCSCSGSADLIPGGVQNPSVTADLRVLGAVLGGFVLGEEAVEDHSSSDRVGCPNSATLRGLHIFVDGSAESVTSDDRDVGGFGLGEYS